MAANGSNEVSAANECFWEIDGFKRTVRRTEDGMQQCSELMKLIQERADIEKEYAKRLRDWSKKWASNVEKGPEYASSKAAMKGCIQATDRLVEVHIAVKDRLINAVQVRVKDWRNEKYKKQIVGGCQQAKAFEEDFRRAQKPWAKKLGKVQKAKKDYYNACRQERAASAQENSTRSAEGVQPDQIRKASERTEKCRKEMEAAKQKYNSALVDLNSINGKYMEDMAEVFERTQQFERLRLEFNKIILAEFHNSLDLSQNPAYKDVYAHIRDIVDKTDVNNDLKWWSDNCGTSMSMSWPAYEEFPGDTVPVDRSEKAAAGAVAVGLTNGSGVDSTASSRYGQHSDQPTYASVRSNRTATTDTTAGGGGYRASAAVMGSEPSMDSYHQTGSSRPVSMGAAFGTSSYSQSSTPDDNSFDEQDGYPKSSYHDSEPTRYENAADVNDYHSNRQPSLASNTLYEEIPSAHVQANPGGGGGVRVRALYDYNAVEDDELTFRSGDVFLMIKEVDAQGWCTGLKDGHVGLYPESYAQPC